MHEFKWNGSGNFKDHPNGSTPDVASPEDVSEPDAATLDAASSDGALIASACRVQAGRKETSRQPCEQSKAARGEFADLADEDTSPVRLARAAPPPKASQSWEERMGDVSTDS